MNTDPLLLTGFLGIITALSGCLVWVVKKVFDVVERNTQVNDRVGTNLDALTNIVTKHNDNTRQIAKNTLDIAKNQRVILGLLSKHK